MLEEPFSNGFSMLHRLDPRVKSLVACVFVWGVAMCRQPQVMSGLLAMGMLLTIQAGLPWRAVLRRLLAVNGFIFFLWLMLPLTYPGEVWADFGPFALSKEGIAVALRATVKSNAILFLFLALVSTSDAATLGHALYRLKVPVKLVFLFLYTYRYVHVLAQEYDRLHTAARLRCFVPRTDMHTYRTAANMLGMIILRSLDRSRRVYDAMVLRGFEGSFHSLRELHVSPRDKVFALLAALAACLMGYVEWIGGISIG